MRPRSAFTLIELLVVLLLLAITAAASVPAFATGRRDPDLETADVLVSLLTNARDAAREQGTRAEVVFAPRQARYWISSGSKLRTGIIPLTTSQRLVGSDSERVVCSFSASGPATVCGLAVRGASDVIVRVDPWTGAFRVSQAVR
ncbi:MAG: prepilin-type N-terminal cleavage/methylation domain-containing protein [bacterium]